MADKKWFVIINPTSGNGLSKKKWPFIKQLLLDNAFDFKFEFTKYSGHSTAIVVDAINNGFRNFICVGGDGTLHNMVNGIMSQRYVPSNLVNVGVIPIGTGNDWVKSHDIPSNIKKAIIIIKNGELKCQDLGEINLLNQSNKPIYFMNLAGAGFDGYVVSKVNKYKHYGAIAYLMGTIFGLWSFKNFKVTIQVNSIIDTHENALMLLIGLCEYSGGGMRLTKNPNPYDGLFDVSIAKNLSKFEIIRNVLNLFNGKLTLNNKVESINCQELTVSFDGSETPFIQADGELLGKGDFKVSILPMAFSFYGNKKG